MGLLEPKTGDGSVSPSPMVCCLFVRLLSCRFVDHFALGVRYQADHCRLVVAVVAVVGFAVDLLVAQHRFVSFAVEG